MKLYNKSRLPDAVLEPLLVAAGRAVGAKTSGVVVKVTQGRNRGVYGAAQRATFVYTWHLKRVQKWKSESVATSGGWFRLTVPAHHPCWDSLAVAESIFKVSMHEWVHIKDYQAMNRGEYKPFASRNPHSNRRIGHDSRPEEERAIDTVNYAISEGAIKRNQDVIIALALEHDRV